jgi:hypothetical protein
VVQFLTPVGELTDAEEYVIRDGEETPNLDWHGNMKPDQTYVMKDSDHFPLGQQSGPPSESERSDDWPQPPDSEGDEGNRLGITFCGPVITEDRHVVRTEWWSEAWSKREGRAVFGSAFAPQDLQFVEAMRAGQPLQFSGSKVPFRSGGKRKSRLSLQLSRCPWIVLRPGVVLFHRIARLPSL